MEKDRFEKLVEEALLDIPENFRKQLDNIVVMVDGKPSKDVYRQTGTPYTGLILGLYHGVPLKHRGPYYGNYPPDVITLFQDHIEKVSRTEKEIKQKVREVVIHEIAHYFGFDDKYLREVENLPYENKEKKG